MAIPNISKDTAISLSLVVILLGAVFSAGLFVATQSGKVDDLEREVAALRVEIRSFRNEFVDSVAVAAGDRWRKGEMKAWADDLQRANPTLDVPPVRDI